MLRGGRIVRSQYVRHEGRYTIVISYSMFANAFGDMIYGHGANSDRLIVV